MMELPEAVTSVIDGAIQFVYSFEPLADKTLVLGTHPVLNVSSSIHPKIALFD
jgi:hypothetical protein